MLPNHIFGIIENISELSVLRNSITKTYLDVNNWYWLYAKSDYLECAKLWKQLLIIIKMIDEKKIKINSQNIAKMHVHSQGYIPYNEQPYQHVISLLLPLKILCKKLLKKSFSWTNRKD